VNVCFPAVSEHNAVGYESGHCGFEQCDFTNSPMSEYGPMGQYVSLCWPMYVCVCGGGQCLKWSKKEAGSLPQSEVEFPPQIFLNLKMVGFGAFWVVFYVI